MRILIQTAVFTIAAAMALPSFAGVWEDNFENEALEGWEIYNFAPDVESWEQRIDEEGNSVVTGRIEENGVRSILELKPEGANPAEWKDYTVRFRMRLDSELVEGVITYFGLWFYTDIENGFYHECTIILPSSLQDIWSYIPNSRGVYRREGDFEPGVWYDIRVTVETLDQNRDRIAFQIDDLEPLVVTWTPSLKSGGVGFVVHYGTVSFDDFKLFGSSIPSGGDALSVEPQQKSAQIWGELKSR